MKIGKHEATRAVNRRRGRKRKQENYEERRERNA